VLTKLRNVWLPYCISILLALVWISLEYRTSLFDFAYYHIVLAVLSVFSIQNIVATPLTTPHRARAINIAVLAAWGIYLGYGAATVGEGQGYAVFGLKLFFITAAPILWAHRKG